MHDATGQLAPQAWELGAAAAAGLTLSQFRFTLAFFLSVAAGALLRFIPTARGRHVFSALSGFLMLYYPFGTGVFHALLTSLLTYVAMMRFRQHCGTLTWITVFPYLILCHVLSASGMAWKEGVLDFTGAQMVVTLKLIAAAVCYQDGLRLAAKKSKGEGAGGAITATAATPAGASPAAAAAAPVAAADKAASGVEGAKQEAGTSSSAAGGSGLAAGHESPLQGYVRRHALERLPSPLEFLSYVFAAGNLLAGPFFEIRDYLDYVERRGDWDVRDPKKRVPSPLVPGLVRFAKGLAFAALWARFSPVYNPTLMESPAWGTFPVWKRMLLLWVVGFTARCKYYFAWAVAESSLIFSGLCFNGWKEVKGEPRPQWTRYINSRIRRVEFCTSAAALPNNWNVCTGTWLRFYVYERLTPPGKRPTFRSMVVTQTVSGVWHGLFPGYWLFFVSTAFMFESAKVLYRYEQGWPAHVRHFLPWVALKMVWTAYILNYCASAFQILSFKESIAVWRSVYFSGHAIMLAIMLVGAALPPRKSRVRPQRAVDEGPAAGAAEGTPAVAALGKEVAAEAAKGAEPKKEK